MGLITNVEPPQVTRFMPAPLRSTDFNEWGSIYIFLDAPCHCLGRVNNTRMPCQRCASWKLCAAQMQKLSTVYLRKQKSFNRTVDRSQFIHTDITGCPLWYNHENGRVFPKLWLRDDRREVVDLQVQHFPQQATAL